MKKFFLLIIFCVAFVATAVCQDVTTQQVISQSFIDQISQTIVGWLIAFGSSNPIWASAISFGIVLLAGLSEYLGQTKKFASNNVLQAVFSLIKKIATIFVSNNKK